MKMPTHALRRVSCPAFALIRDNGRYGLMKDMQHNRGLIPVGGALRAEAASMLMLINELRADAQSFETGDGLRFVLPAANVPQVATWFATRKGRDTSMSRMLLTSLFHETGVLTRRQVAQARQKLAGYTRGSNDTTDYLVELYNVAFPSPVMEMLRAQSNSMRSDFWFVSDVEIMQGRMRRNGLTFTINSICTSLLEPSPQLPLG
jgi:hypothetical protein